MYGTRAIYYSAKNQLSQYTINYATVLRPGTQRGNRYGVPVSSSLVSVSGRRDPIGPLILPS